MGTYECQGLSGWCEQGSQGVTTKILSAVVNSKDIDMILQIGDISMLYLILFSIMK